MAYSRGMNNPYCDTFENVRALYIDHQKRLARARFDFWARMFPRHRIKEQLDTQSGTIIDDIKSIIRKAVGKTEFVEFLMALQMADFYFPNQEKQVCFDLKRGVDPKTIKTYQDLIESFEDYTHVDCLVRSGKESISFQVKRYRGDNTPEAFISWLNERVLKHYGNMSGTSLVIVLQPAGGSAPAFALDKVYEAFVRDAQANVSFDRVSMIYNDGGKKYMVLHELFPKHHRKMIDLDLALARMRGDA